MAPPHLKIHDPADSEYREPPQSRPTGKLCPFRSAAIPQQAKHPVTGQVVTGIAFTSGPCVRECAGYDQVGDRTCFDRGFAAFGALGAAKDKTE